MKTRKQIDESIKRLERDLEELKAMRSEMEVNPIVELHGEVGRMRFSKEYSNKDIVDYVLNWKA